MFLMERKRSLNKDTVVMKILVLLWQDVKIITNLLLTRGNVTPAALISSPILRHSVLYTTMNTSRNWFYSEIEHVNATLHWN